jgi:4'-phosphopantetheinyl transferase
MGWVDLWLWPYEGADSDAFEAAYNAWLTAEEKARVNRLRFERDRQVHAAARVLVRGALSHYQAVDPSEWRFVSDPLGKPRVAARPGEPVPHFNLSHTAGLAACVVSLGHEEIGIDVERLDRQADFLSVAESCFAPAEHRQLRTMEPSLLARRFLASWTIKESYAKARGLGLSLPLDAVRVLPEDNNPEGSRLGVVFDASLDDSEDQWRFTLLEAHPGHLVAVAAKTAASPLALRTRHFELTRSDFLVTCP